MAIGARTLTLEETFLEPGALEPPPTRHALFILLLALAAMLHLGTAGWGDVYDGLEGQFAGGAREMLLSQQWFVPTNDGVPRLDTPPLVYWLIALSYKALGVTPMAARLPAAIAMIVSVGLTFLIGERLAGYWRGFSAGLIHLCFAGTFLVGRSATAEPVASAFIAGAIYCAVCGYQRRPFRRAWFTGFWLCAGLGCLSKGTIVLVDLAGTLILSAIFFREARLRFQSLLHWMYLALFLCLVVPWYVWILKDLPGLSSMLFVWPGHGGLSRWEFFLLHFAWWFPASILVLPGMLFSIRKIMRPNEITLADVLPLFWIATGFLPLLVPNHQPVYSSIPLWGAFALWTALVWERTPRSLQVAGLSLLFLIGAILIGLAVTPKLWYGPAAAWINLRQLVGIAGLALGMFAILALYSAIRQRPEMALLLALVSMVPVGLCLTEGASRASSFFSLAGAARFLNVRLADGGQVFFDGPLRRASSLAFYLNQPFLLVGQQRFAPEGENGAVGNYVTEDSFLDGWKSSNPSYLIVDQARVSHWQAKIISRAHIFHQVTTCGHYVVLSNQL